MHPRRTGQVDPGVGPPIRRPGLKTASTEVELTGLEPVTSCFYLHLTKGRLVLKAPERVRTKSPTLIYLRRPLCGA